VTATAGRAPSLNSHRSDGDGHRKVTQHAQGPALSAERASRWLHVLLRRTGSRRWECCSHVQPSLTPERGVRHICNTGKNVTGQPLTAGLDVDLRRDRQPNSFTKPEPEPIIWHLLTTLNGTLFERTSDSTSCRGAHCCWSRD